MKLPRFVETEHLYLRRWKYRDVKALYAQCADPDFAHRAGFLALNSYLAAWIRLVSCYMAGTGYAVELKKSGALIGSISLMDRTESHIPLAPEDMEAGYWIGKSWWGHGYAAEAMAAALDTVFATGQVGCIWCVVAADNAQSHRVQEKLGFRYNRTETIAGVQAGSKLLCQIYQLSDQDWRCQK